MNVSLKLNCEHNRFFEVFVQGRTVGECDLKFFQNNGVHVGK